MEERNLSQEELIIMCTIWNENSLSSISDMTHKINKKYGVRWKNPMTVLVLERLMRWGYADLRKTGAGIEIVAVVSQQEYAEAQIRYGRMRKSIFEAAFSKDNALSLEEVDRLRDLIDELE